MPIQQGRHPGELYIPGYGNILAVSWDEGLIYDRVALTTGSGVATVAAGSELTFFRDVQSKNDLQTNMSLSSQLPSGWEMIVLKAGIYIPSTAVETDVEMIMRYAYCEFVLDNTFVAKSGLMPMFALGYGVHGNVSVGHTSAAVIDFYANGVAGFASVPNLEIPLVITDKRTFKGSVHFYDQLTFAANDTTVNLTMMLYGFLRQPAQ